MYVPADQNKWYLFAKLSFMRLECSTRDYAAGGGTGVESEYISLDGKIVKNLTIKKRFP